MGETEQFVGVFEEFGFIGVCGEPLNEVVHPAFRGILSLKLVVQQELQEGTFCHAALQFSAGHCEVAHGFLVILIESKCPTEDSVVFLEDVLQGFLRDVWHRLKGIEIVEVGDALLNGLRR